MSKAEQIVIILDERLTEAQRACAADAMASFMRRCVGADVPVRREPRPVDLARRARDLELREAALQVWSCLAFAVGGAAGLAVGTLVGWWLRG